MLPVESLTATGTTYSFLIKSDLYPSQENDQSTIHPSVFDIHGPEGSSHWPEWCVLWRKPQACCGRLLAESLGSNPSQPGEPVSRLLKQKCGLSEWNDCDVVFFKSRERPQRGGRMEIYAWKPLGQISLIWPTIIYPKPLRFLDFVSFWPKETELWTPWWSPNHPSQNPHSCSHPRNIHETPISLRELCIPASVEGIWKQKTTAPQLFSGKQEGNIIVSKFPLQPLWNRKHQCEHLCPKILQPPALLTCAVVQGMQPPGLLLHAGGTHHFSFKD